MTGHVIDWEYDMDMVRARLICQEPEGADCRLNNGFCDCEVWRVQRDPDGTPFHTCTEWNDEAGVEFEARHEMQSQSECNVVLYTEECLEEANGKREVRLLVSTPIEPVWEGDYYSWIFKEES